MEVPTYFEEFLSATAPTKQQKGVMVREHTTLRERLAQDPILKTVVKSSFIQGSHRRFTANRGTKEHPCDVDIVAVTNLPRAQSTAAHALEMFEPFLKQHYPGRYTAQDRSWCISVDDEVTLDLVPTSAPDSLSLEEVMAKGSLLNWNPEAGSRIKGALGLQSLTEALLDESRQDQEFDKSEPLWIPDRERHVWEKTHPLYLIGWTAKKNLLTNGNFIHVVRAIKWWRREVEPLPKYPKGYPLEHMVGDCCPDGITSVGAGIASTLAEIVRRFGPFAGARQTPPLQSRGITHPDVNVMRRVSGEDFAAFHARASFAAEIAKQALNAKSVQESVVLWGKLFGGDFPQPPKDDVKVTGGYTPPSAVSRPTEGRFA